MPSDRYWPDIGNRMDNTESFPLSGNLSISGIKCLVTGATGFIGQHLCDQLLTSGAEVYAQVRSGSDLRGLRNRPGLNLVFGQMSDISWLTSLPQDLALVLHLALDWDRLDATEDARLCEALGRFPLHRMIYVSSICAAGLDLSRQPLSEDNHPSFLERDYYGKYKWEVEEYIRNKCTDGGLSAAIIRPTIVYGPGDRSNVFPLFAGVRKDNLSLWQNGGNRIRFCYIGNLLAFIEELIKDFPHGANTYHVGDLECEPLRMTCKEIAAALGMKFKYTNHAAKRARELSFIRFVTNRLGLTDSFATHFNYDKWSRSIEADISKMQRDFPGLEFTPMPEAVRVTARSYFKEGIL